MLGLGRDAISLTLSVLVLQRIVVARGVEAIGTNAVDLLVATV